MAMTAMEHQAKLQDMERRRRRLIKKRKQQRTLAEKLAVNVAVGVLDEQIRQHKLNYFELVTG